VRHAKLSLARRGPSTHEAARLHAHAAARAASHGPSRPAAYRPLNIPKLSKWTVMWLLVPHPLLERRPIPGASRTRLLRRAGRNSSELRDELPHAAEEFARRAVKKSQQEHSNANGVFQQHTDMECVMDWNRVEGNWKQVKGKIKEKWGRLTDDDLDVIKGRRDQLEGKIQDRYGLAKDQVQKDVDDWYTAQRW
jgi:uncharacterized protein YjbJ (UPF0337 family)